MDRVPAALRVSGKDKLDYFSKIPLGYKSEADQSYYIYNHMEMVVKLGQAGNQEETYRVLGFEIEPKSIN